MNKVEVENLSNFASLFTNHLRVRIVDLLLPGPMVVNEIALELKESQAVISKQLGILKESGVVGCCPKGKCRQYGIPHPQQTRKLLKLVDELLKTIKNRKNDEAKNVNDESKTH